MEEEKRREEEVAEPECEVKHRGWKAMPYVIGNETFEKLGTLGTSSNMLVYLTTIFHMNSVTAATLLSVFNGTTNLTPLLGAFLCDTFFGRYLTLGFASIASFMGMFFLTLTSAIPTLHPGRCLNESQPCSGPTDGQLAVLFLAFVFMIIGAGGIRPCNLAFGADQFDHRTESGKKGISSFFNWYYFTYAFAVMISATVIIYVQSDVSWTWGLAIPTVLMFCSVCFFFVGTPIYVKVKPEGSPFTNIVHVLVAAFRKRGLKKHEHPSLSLFDPPHKSTLTSKLPYTDQFRFLDKAAVITPTDKLNPDGTPINPWSLCSLQHVEEVKCIVRIIPVWSTGILFFMAVTQNSSYVVFQALQSNRHLGNTTFRVPAASFSIFGLFALTIWIPFYDRFLVPFLKRITGKDGGITLLQRMGIGIVISIIAMIVAGIIEEKRRNMSHSFISSMSAFWLVPQLVLLGFAEAFNIIAQLEFYYKQFPEHMRSVAGCSFFLSSALASYLSGFLVQVIHKTTGGVGKNNWLDSDLNKGRLDYFYFLIATIGAANFVYFLVCAKWYRYKGMHDAPEIVLQEVKNLNETQV